MLCALLALAAGGASSVPAKYATPTSEGCAGDGCTAVLSAAGPLGDMLLQVHSATKKTNLSNSRAGVSAWRRSGSRGEDCTEEDCDKQADRSLAKWATGAAIQAGGDAVVGGLAGMLADNADETAKVLRTSSKVVGALSGAVGPIAGVAFGFLAEYFIPDPNAIKIEALEKTTCCLDMRLTALESKVTQEVARLDSDIKLIREQAVTIQAVEAVGAATDQLSNVRHSITSSVRDFAHCADPYRSYVPQECNCAAFATFVAERGSDLSGFITASQTTMRALMLGRAAAFINKAHNLQWIFNELLTLFNGVLADVVLLWTMAYNWVDGECWHRLASCNGGECCPKKTDSRYCYTRTAMSFEEVGEENRPQYFRNLGRCLRADAQCSHGAQCANPPLFELVRFQKYVINEIFMQNARMLRGYVLLANCGNVADEPQKDMDSTRCNGDATGSDGEDCHAFSMTMWVSEFMGGPVAEARKNLKHAQGIPSLNARCAAHGSEDNCKNDMLKPSCGKPVAGDKRIVKEEMVGELEQSLRALWKIADMTLLFGSGNRIISKLSGQREWTEKKAKRIFYNVYDNHVHGDVSFKWPFHHRGVGCSGNNGNCNSKKSCPDRRRRSAARRRRTITDHWRYRFGGLIEEGEEEAVANASDAADNF